MRIRVQELLLQKDLELGRDCAVDDEVGRSCDHGQEVGHGLQAEDPVRRTPLLSVLVRHAFVRSVDVDDSLYTIGKGNVISCR